MPRTEHPGSEKPHPAPHALQVKHKCNVQLEQARTTRTMWGLAEGAFMNELTSKQCD